MNVSFLTPEFLGKNRWNYLGIYTYRLLVAGRHSRGIFREIVSGCSASFSGDKLRLLASPKKQNDLNEDCAPFLGVSSYRYFGASLLFKKLQEAFPWSRLNSYARDYHAGSDATDEVKFRRLTPKSKAALFFAFVKLKVSIGFAQAARPNFAQKATQESQKSRKCFKGKVRWFFRYTLPPGGPGLVPRFGCLLGTQMPQSTLKTSSYDNFSWAPRLNQLGAMWVPKVTNLLKLLIFISDVRFVRILSLGAQKAPKNST